MSFSISASSLKARLQQSPFPFLTSPSIIYYISADPVVCVEDLTLLLLVCATLEANNQSWAAVPLHFRLVLYEEEVEGYDDAVDVVKGLTFSIFASV